MSDIDDHYGEDIPRPHEEMEAHELVTALSGLALLRDDLAMSSQAFNIATVDQFLMVLEMDFFAQPNG